MEVNYQAYAEGEALLGWLNCTIQLDAREFFDSDAFLKRLAGQVQQRLQEQQAEVAHLKMTLSPEDSLFHEIAAINLVGNDYAAELSLKLETPIKKGQLILNLRAEAAPEALGRVVHEALAASTRDFPTLNATLDHLEHFRPGKPSPAHRFETSS